jgi:hypothetical protein
MLSLCLIKDDAMKMYRGMGLYPRGWRLVEVTGVPCGLASVHLGEELVVALGRRLGWAQSWFGHGEETVCFQKSYPLPSHYLYFLLYFSKKNFFQFFLFAQHVIPFSTS